MKFLSALPILLLLGCAAAPLPRSVFDAQTVSSSKAGEQARELSPQAFAEAEKLRGEAEFLHDEHRNLEAEAAGYQSLSAYNEAFALAQMSLAEERVQVARKAKESAALELKRLDMLQTQIEQEAQSYEMQARVALDTEGVKDVDQISPARAEARRLAAKQLAAEASLLCLGAELLKAQSKTLEEVKTQVGTLRTELGQGSIKTDLYPRAAELRASCLKELTLARRPKAQESPQSSDSDELLASISSAGKYMVYRDDRGIVVNLGQPVMSTEGKLTLTDFAREGLQFLGGASKAHKSYPLLVVVHTKSRNDQKRGEEMGKLASAELESAGAPTPKVAHLDNAQPVAYASIPGAAEKNERIEIVFVVPGR